MKKSRPEIPVFSSEKKNVKLSCKWAKKTYDEFVSECIKYNNRIVLENLVS